MSAVALINHNGTLNNCFSSDAKVSIYSGEKNGATGNGLAIQKDGKILIANSYARDSYNYDFTINRLLAPNMCVNPSVFMYLLN